LPKEPEPIEELLPKEEFSAPEDSAPPSVDVPSATETAAPKQGAVSLQQSDAITSWQSALLGHLERHKRYPRQARRNRQEAVVMVRVMINRDGSVVEYHLQNPSAYSILNKAALAVINRAQPLPPPPPEVTGDTLEFVVPVVFSLRR